MSNGIAFYFKMFYRLNIDFPAADGPSAHPYNLDKITGVQLQFPEYEECGVVWNEGGREWRREWRPKRTTIRPITTAVRPEHVVGEGLSSAPSQFTAPRRRVL